MDRAQTRLLVVLSTLVLLVGGILYWQGDRDEEDADPEATVAVWEIEPDQVNEVTVDRAGGKLHLKREGEQWNVLEPFSARADDDQVHELLDALRDLRRGIPVEGADARPAEFGLGEPPEAVVELVRVDGTTAKLTVGSLAPVGYRTYLRNDKGEIAAVNGDPNRVLQADAGRFRDRRVFRFDPAEVRSVTIVSPDGTLSVTGEGKDWWLEGFARADADRVDDLVVGLLDLRFEGMLPDKLVIEPVLYQVSVGLQDGTVLTLQTGDPAPTDAGIQAVTNEGRAGTLFPEAVRQFGRGPTDLGASTAFGLRLEVADSVEIARADRKVLAQRDGPGWKAEGLDDGAVYDSLLALSRVPIEYRRDPPPPPSPVELTVTVKEGERTLSVQLGPPGEDGLRSAKDLAGGEPFLVPTAPLDQALQGL